MKRAVFLFAQQRFIFLSFAAVFLVGLSLHLISIAGNNFYFTMDQGNEAVHAREIWYRHQLILTGPETSIPGLFNGPLWHWFISVGYLIFMGHPIGPLLFLISLNLGLSIFLMRKILQHVSFWSSIIVGLSLQFFWPFFDTSRYAFSPFVLVFSSVTTILLLESFLRGNKRSFILAAIPVGIVFHSELASFPPFLFLYISMGIWSFFKKRLRWNTVVYTIFVLFLFFIPHLISEIQTDFEQFRSIQKHLTSQQTVFLNVNPMNISHIFTKLIGESVIHKKPYIGAIFYCLIFLIFIKYRNKNIFIKRFVFLSILLVAVSWIWFSTNRGWHSWHTVYITPVLFIALLLMFFSFPRKARTFLILGVLVSQLLFFKGRYLDVLRPSKDPSLLKNELQAIDWVYEKANSDGFFVYIYIPSVYDWPYQYLFWWYGNKKYGYVPCEYSTYPNVPDLFVPGLEYYQKPIRPCNNIRFLIVEPDKNTLLQNQWIDGVTKNTVLIQKARIGEITLEQRSIK